MTDLTLHDEAQRCHDWTAYHAARGWRETPKLTIEEARTAGIIGLLLFLVGLPCLVVLFCWFN